MFLTFEVGCVTKDVIQKDYKYATSYAGPTFNTSPTFLRMELITKEALKGEINSNGCLEVNCPFEIGP